MISDYSSLIGSSYYFDCPVLSQLDHSCLLSPFYHNSPTRLLNLPSHHPEQHGQRCLIQRPLVPNTNFHPSRGPSLQPGHQLSSPQPLSRAKRDAPGRIISSLNCHQFPPLSAPSAPPAPAGGPRSKAPGKTTPLLLPADV